MKISELDIKKSYRIPRDNIVNLFYTPLLKNAISYDRSVGFFSSEILIEISYGLCEFVKNGGKIRIITSPHLSKDDYDAINNGYKMRDEVIQDALLRELKQHDNYYEKERLNLVSSLIASGVLELKISFSYHDGFFGLYHEKLGIISGENGEYVAFSGSMNESKNAVTSNYEVVDVFSSWVDSERAQEKKEAFDVLWEDNDSYAKVIDFPDIVKKEIIKYNYKEENFDIDIEQFSKMVDEANGKPHIPKDVELRQYQEDAISAWRKNNYCGIYDMATGTGKTYTALASIVNLYSDVRGKLAIVIVCPYQHLVEQWREDIEMFGIKPLLCYSASSQRDWKNRLKNYVRSFELDLIDYFCIVTTNATFSTKYMQDLLKKLHGKTLLVADEAHNLGTENYSECLLPNFKYRLALSATIERYEDLEGTKRLFDYFGSKCISYSLKDAIDNEMLTPYYYYPIVVNFDEDELERYLEISTQIAKHIRVNKRGKKYIDDVGKALLIKRARIVAGAKEKLIKLKQLLKDKTTESHKLIYCGATTLRDVDYIEGEPTIDEIKQIDAAVNIVGNELGMKVAKFTSEESVVDRELIKSEFDIGKQLQALVAIRCLDEGVNIPSISEAYILASSTNPKEYIQRRGRVLRKYPGKEYAYIYDFVTIPIALDSVDLYSEEVIKCTKSLVKKELIRIDDFAKIARNPYEVDDLVFDIKNAFSIDLSLHDESEDEFYE